MKIQPAGKFPIGFNDDGFNVLNLIISQFARCPIDRLNMKIHCELSRMFVRPLSGGFHEPLDLSGFFMLRGLKALAKRGLGKKKGELKLMVPTQSFVNFDGLLFWLLINEFCFFSVIHSAFFKAELDILQFYTFVKAQRWMTEDEAKRLPDFGLNFKQRAELRSLLYGLHFLIQCNNVNLFNLKKLFVANRVRTHDLFAFETGILSPRPPFILFEIPFFMPCWL